MVSAEYYDMVDKQCESIRRGARLPPLDAKCHEMFEKHVVIGHTGEKIRCYSCCGTDRAPIPWGEVMQHG